MARRKVLAAQLNSLVKELAMGAAQCKSCTVGPVVEIRPDASGCNWKISAIQGSHSSACLMALSEQINALRSQYALDCSGI